MSNQKKILFICDKDECTSFGRLTLNLVKAVAPQYEAHVLWLKTPKFFGPRSDMGNVPKSGYVSHEIWAKSLYEGYLSFRKPLRRIIRDVSPDCVFFIRPELGFLIPVAKRELRRLNDGARVTMFIHDTFAETLYPHSLKFRLINLFYTRPTIQADSFVYNSRWTQNQAVQYFGKKLESSPGTVIGCPIDSDLFNRPAIKVTAEERSEFRRKFRLKNYDGMCLNVSLDEPRKNIETFFEMARLCPDTAFVRVGKLSERLREIINVKKLYNVHHFEQFSAQELREFYRHADLIVYPSFLEGFGLPPIEAIACGTPAVCAATSAVQENLEGVCPLVSPADDAGKYADVWQQVKNGEDVVDWNAAANLLEHCSMKSFSLRVCDFFKSIGL